MYFIIADEKSEMVGDTATTFTCLLHVNPSKMLVDNVYHLFSSLNGF